VLSGHRSVVGLTKKDITSLIKQIKIRFNKKFIRKCIKNILKWEKLKNKNKNRKYFKRIIKYIKQKESFQKLTHLIFGHTHKMETKPIKAKNQEIILANSGSWQKTCKPTYLEINLDTFEINPKRMKLSDKLRLLRLFNKIFEALGLEFRNKLMKQYPREQEKIVDYSEMELFKAVKEKNLISQDNLENLEKYFQYRQEYFTQPKKEVSLDIVKQNIEDLRDIYINV